MTQTKVTPSSEEMLLRHTLLHFQKTQLFTDLKVVCTDGSLACHRALLYLSFPWRLPTDLDCILLPDQTLTSFQAALEAFYLSLDASCVQNLFYWSNNSIEQKDKAESETEPPALDHQMNEAQGNSKITDVIDVDHLRDPEKQDDLEQKENDAGVVDQNARKSRRHFCSICEQSFRSLAQRDRHVETHQRHQETTFPCTQCDQTFVTADFLRKHERRHQLLACEACDSFFESYTDLLNHKKLHRPPPQKEACTVCGKLVSFLARHMKSVHNNRESFACDYCDYKTNNARNLKRHTDFTHLGITHQCDICEAVLSSKSSLSMHMQKHQDSRPWVCSECGDTFKRKKNLEAHISNKHSKETFNCSECMKTFKSINSLDYHKRSHDQTKQFPCQVCGKRFLTKSKLREHNNIHTGKKPHQCTVCGKRYHSSDQLSHHKKVCQIPPITMSIEKTDVLEPETTTEADLLSREDIFDT